MPVMPAWPALLIAPLLALLHVSVAFALVTPSCATQQVAWMHTASAGLLILALIFTAMAVVRSGRLGPRQPVGADSDEMDNRARFVAWVAAMTGALSSLVIVAIWIPQWLLSPCVA